MNYNFISVCPHCKCPVEEETDFMILEGERYYSCKNNEQNHLKLKFWKDELEIISITLLGCGLNIYPSQNSVAIYGDKSCSGTLGYIPEMDFTDLNKLSERVKTWITFS